MIWNLVIIAHMLVDIDWLIRGRNNSYSWAWHVLFSLHNIIYLDVFGWPSPLKKLPSHRKEAIFKVCIVFQVKTKTNTA